MKKWYNIRYKWKKCLTSDLRSLDPNIYLYLIVSNAFSILSSSVLFLGKSFFRISTLVTELGLVADFCPSAVLGWADCVSGFTSVKMLWLAERQMRAEFIHFKVKTMS